MQTRSTSIKNPNGSHHAGGSASWRRGVILALACCTTLGITAGSAHAEFVAARITAENFDTHHVGGPDAIAGAGDWFISNGTVCAVISDTDHMTAIAPQGGVLIDLGHCGARDDQWTVLQPILNLSMSQIAPVSQILSGSNDQHAWIQTRAIAIGVEITTTYSLDLDRPTALSVSLLARRLEDGDRLFALGSIVLHPSGQTPAFSMLRSDLERSRGFVYPAASGQSAPSLLTALVSSDLTILVGGDEMPPISYGLERVGMTLREAEISSDLASFGVTGRHFTLLNSLTRPPWFERMGKPPGLLQFVQLPFMDLKRASTLSSASRIWVGERADVASITDQLWSSEAVLEGSIDDPTARIHIDLASGAPVTEIRPNPEGRFAFHLPAGTYRGRAIGSAGRRAEFDFTVAEPSSANPIAKATPQSLPAISLGSPGWLQLPKEFIGRLVFLNTEDGTAVVFGDHHLGFKIGEEIIPSGLEAPFLNLANSPLDPKRIALPTGRYRVIATRGPEYEAIETLVEIQPGEPAHLEIPLLQRTVATPGWLAADLHVHSGVSFDSNLPQTKQIIAFAASGAEVLVATEHDRIFDPRPAIADSRLAGQLVSITGAEVTSAVGDAESPHHSAHLNAFPLVPKTGLFGSGAPSLRRQRLRDSLAEIREINSTVFVQLNHPRSALDTLEDDAYFEHLGEVGEPFVPTSPLTDRPNSALLEVDPKHGLRDLDYHGVELLNAASLLRYRRVRADWFALMRQGERIVGTANSDSHRLGEIVGLPRTYVQVADDALESFDEARFLQALHEGRAYGSTGPILTVHLDQAGVGDLHEGTSGILHVKVEAADWVPITEWRAYVNGEQIHRAKIAAGETAALPLVFGKDAFVTVEVQGTPEGLYADVLPNYIPFAFTNPIFVDVDGNGRFDPPGLTGVLPTTITDPDRPD
jgi:hypothetical protein